MDNRRISFNIGDVDEAISIIREAANWLIDTDKPLWELEELTREKLLKYNNSDEFHVLKVNNVSAAAMILKWEDKLIWPNVKQGESGFIHKLSVRRIYSGTGISRKMIEHAIEECKKRNITFIRLDCAADREKLCSFYKDFGFKQVDRRTVWKYDCAFFEFNINSI
jgi:ribosomal protein S18 acetylase RimI-like enzyme